MKLIRSQSPAVRQLGTWRPLDYIQHTVGANLDFIYSENEPLSINVVHVRSTYDGNTSPMTGLHNTLVK